MNWSGKCEGPGGGDWLGALCTGLPLVIMVSTKWVLSHQKQQFQPNPIAYNYPMRTKAPCFNWKNVKICLNKKTLFGIVEKFSMSRCA
jgi:hypothetical protein